MTLRPYQSESVAELAQMLTRHRKVMFQLPTGGGKTVTFAAISKRYTDKSDKDVLIIVHRKELLNQARGTIYKMTGLACQAIIAGMKRVPKARVYIAMVESLKNRLPDNIGLVIIDEAHIANFNKCHDWFPDQLIVGFTATPLSANKLKPCKMFYDEIVIGSTIPQLIKDGYLSQNITYAPKDVVERRLLSIASNGEFDERQMGETYSQPKYIKNAVDAYIRHAKGMKAIVFNCNIEHSLLVADAFDRAGFNARHIDGTTADFERNNAFSWFKHTDGAILCNVGIATTGFDEPTIEAVLVNRATTSLPLWLQMTGRGSRVTENKSMFIIIDMGGNAAEHKDWNWNHDWRKIFHHPKKKKPKGEQPLSYKSCDNCEALITVSTKICPICGHDHRAKLEAEIEQELGSYMIVTQGIDVDRLIELNKHRKKYYPFYEIGRRLCNAIPTGANLDLVLPVVLEDYKQKAKIWCDKHGIKWSEWHEKQCEKKIREELKLISEML